MNYKSLFETITKHGQTNPSAIALSSTEGEVISYGDLSLWLFRIQKKLRAFGFGPKKVALLAMPDGPEALMMILALSSLGAVFPVPFRSNREDYERQIQETSPEYIVIPERGHRELETLCHESKRSLLKVNCSKWTELDVDGQMPSNSTTSSEWPDQEDPSILIATSGTSSFPKVIASSQRSIFKSISYCANWTHLNHQHKSICIMPFAHLHALVRSTLPILWVGGEVLCTPGFDKKKFLKWVLHHKPTYLSTVPSLYRAILLELENVPTFSSPFEIIVCGSDHLDQKTEKAIVETFGIPLLQFYGLTEVSPLLATSGPEKKPVGAIGKVNPDWELAILDDEMNLLEDGSEGQIVCKGGIVNPIISHQHGYTQSYHKNFFLTGDCGCIKNGYLFIKGRVNLRIHSAGKKIQPSAVEAVILQMPEVNEVKVFAVKDPIKGEKVALAYTLKPGTELDENRIFTHALTHLTSYMVPEYIVKLSELPKNISGKISLDALKQLTEHHKVCHKTPAQLPPNTASQWRGTLEKLFSKYLELDSIPIDQDFYALGGDSLAALHLLIELEDDYGIVLSPPEFLNHSSIIALETWLSAKPKQTISSCRAVRPEGHLPILFIAHGPFGNFPSHAGIKKFVAHNRPIFGLECVADSKGHYLQNFKTLASTYAKTMLDLQQNGPFYLAGFSFGAHLAYEIAQCLVALGHSIAFLGLIDDEADLLGREFNSSNRKVPLDNKALSLNQAFKSNVLEPFYGCPLTLFRSQHTTDGKLSSYLLDWNGLAGAGLNFYEVPGSHDTLMSEQGFSRWADQFNKALLGHASPQYPAKLPLSHKVFTLARKSGKNGNLKEEIQCYLNGLKTNANAPHWVYENLIQALVQAKKPSFALEIDYAAITYSSDRLISCYRFIHRAIERKDLKAVNLCLQRLTTCQPTQFHEIKLYCEILTKIGQGKKARTILAHHLQSNPCSTIFLCAFGRLEQLLSNYLAARRYYEKALEIDNFCSEAYLNLCTCLLKLQLPKEAYHYASLANKYLPLSHKLKQNFADVCLKIGYYAQAIRELESLKAKNGLRTTANLMLAQAYWKNDQKLLAYQLLDDAIRVEKTKIVYVDLKMHLYFMDKNYPECQQLCLNILAIKANHYPAMILLNRIATYHENWSAAKKWGMKAYQFMPPHLRSEIKLALQPKN